MGPNDIARNAVRSKHIKAGNVKPPDVGFVPAARYTNPLASNCGLVSVENGSDTVIRWAQAFFHTGGVKGVAACNPNGSPRSALVAPRDGFYEVDGGVLWSSDATGTFRKIAINAGGNEFAANTISPTDPSSQTISTLVEFTKAEPVELVASGDPTSTLELPQDVRTYLAFHWVGPSRIGSGD